MDNVSAMAINQGLTKRGKDRTTLQSLCKDQGWYLKKSQHVSMGTCFASTKDSLSEKALTYLKNMRGAVLLLAASDVVTYVPALRNFFQVARCTNDDEYKLLRMTIIICYSI